MIDAKITVTALGVAAAVGQVPDVLPEGAAEAVSGMARFASLGATTILGVLMWRLIDRLGGTIDANTVATDRMREHCSAKNGEAPERSR
jgi:hypothetical protein